jgi:carboxylesterase type B
MGNSVNHLFKGKEVPSREVQISDGRLLGRRLILHDERPVDAFQGIPFAEAPLGELRFKKPIPPKPWEGIRLASKFARRGIQKDFIFTERFVRGPCSEDCLYLNVFSPGWTEHKSFPVLVFIHGGAFVSDSAIKYGDIGICEHLVAEHGVVVVTIQYRLGFFGFFSTGDDACDDNVALWDMSLGLYALAYCEVRSIKR